MRPEISRRRVGIRTHGLCHPATIQTQTSVHSQQVSSALCVPDAVGVRSLIIFLLPLCFSVRAASVVSIISLDPLPAFRGSITLDSQGNWLAIATDGVLKKIAPDGRTVIFMRNFAAGSTVATSPAGDIYVVGMSDTITASSGSFQTTGGPGFLMKLNSSGEPLFTARINATPRAVAVGPSGDVFVAGKADEGFITTELAFQRLHSRFPKTDCTNPLGGLFFPMFCGDAFVMRVSPDGTQLRYATYLGGTYQEDVSGMKVDAFGNAYVVGITLSENFPVTTNAFDTTFGGRQRISIGTAVGDGFAAKLDPQGQHLEWSTYVGGSDGGEAFLVIELAGEDEVYVTGGTASSDFPATPGAFRAEYAGLFSGAFTTGDTFLVTWVGLGRLRTLLPRRAASTSMRPATHVSMAIDCRRPVSLPAAEWWSSMGPLVVRWRSCMLPGWASPWPMLLAA